MSEIYRPTTEVFRKSAKRALLGKEKDFCNPKNLADVRGVVEKLQTERIEIPYSPDHYMTMNLIRLLRKSTLSAKEQKLGYFEIRGAWDNTIDKVHTSQIDDPYKFKERKVYNLFWLENRFHLNRNCKKISLENGEIRFLDKEGNVIVGFSLDLKSRAREMAESEAKIVECQAKRKEQQEETAKASIEKKGVTEFEYFADADSYLVGDGKSDILVNGTDFYRKYKHAKIEVYQEIDLLGAAVWHPRRNCYVWEKPADPKQKGRKVYFKHRQIYAIIPKREPARIVKAEKPQAIKAEKPQAIKAKRPPRETAKATPKVPEARPEATHPEQEPQAVAQQSETPESQQIELSEEIRDAIRPLLNDNGHFSIAFLGGREKGEGAGAGLFDTMKQIIYDPSTNKLLIANYARDMRYGRRKLHASTKNRPRAARRAMENLSGEEVPFHIALGLKETVEIFDILIQKITGPVKVTLPANYVIDFEGKYIHFPKKTVLKNGKEALALAQFRHGWIVPDDYDFRENLRPDVKLPGVAVVGSDESVVESKSRVARQDAVITGVFKAFAEKFRGKSKWAIGLKYGADLLKIQKKLAASTNLPIALTDFNSLAGLINIARLYSKGGSKSSLYLHHNADESARLSFKRKVRRLVPTNRPVAQKSSPQEGKTG